MPWVKLDDTFWSHPRATCAGNAGAGIFSRMLSYCGCYLTDGLVPEHIAAFIVGSDKKAFDTLKQFGLIEVLESGGVVIPDYLDYNRSKADVERERKQRSAAGRASANRRRGVHDE